MSLQSVITRVL